MTLYAKTWDMPKPDIYGLGIKLYETRIFFEVLLLSQNLEAMTVQATVLDDEGEEQTVFIEFNEEFSMGIYNNWSLDRAY